MHFPKVVYIKRIVEETPTVKTFIFPWEINKEIPGQFIMLWNFQDEKPMSISLLDPVNDEIGLSIKNVGPFTNTVHRLKEGDQLGLRGPYGRGFQIAGSKILAVGGGVGMAPIAALVEESTRRGLEVDLITAASTREEILFEDRLKTAGVNMFPSTDDGSHGFCGFATELAEELLLKTKYDMMVSCGPEIMMKKLFDLSERFQLPAQFSLERWMKCALGLCGQCCMDDVGWRVCVEGPVFCSHEIRLLSEFGQYNRDASGIKTIFEK
jgi:dihydroorotate dehydrogenase electron transfer subunit